MMLLEAINVSKTYREGTAALTALAGVSLAIDAGEIVALEGPSGSGKTTLLSILGCILTPSAGRVVIGGEAVDFTRQDQLQRIRQRAIGFVFQQYNLFPALSALENVEYALNVRGIHGKAAHTEAERAITAVGLRDRAGALPRDLSGGQKQRIAIARALSGPASVILADEPTANLDFETGAAILQLLRALAKEHGRAALIVTHDPRVSAIADRGLRIRDGRLIEQPERAGVP
jgi:putative ABC transport system ATP-binding protein